MCVARVLPLSFFLFLVRLASALVNLRWYKKIRMLTPTILWRLPQLQPTCNKFSVSANTFEVPGTADALDARNNAFADCKG